MSETTKSTSLAVIGGGVDGLEDVDAADILTPIIRMDHDDGVFVSSLDNRTFKEFDAICLGLVKQRILWPGDPGGSGEQPLCRAYDHEHGHPDQERFHLITKGASGFDLARVADADKNPLPCADCNLKNWDTHPRSTGSWCNEQYTIPMLVIEDGGFMPALMSFQRSAIKPVKAFISGFVGRKRPLFTNVTHLSITMVSGKGIYAVPKFEVRDESDPAMWPEFSKHFHQIRNLITTPRGRASDDADPEVAEVAPVEPRPTNEAAASVASEVATDAGAGGTKRPSPKPAPAPDPVYGDEEPF